MRSSRGQTSLPTILRFVIRSAYTRHQHSNNNLQPYTQTPLLRSPLNRSSALPSIHQSFFHKLESGKSYAILPAPRSVATSQTIAPLLFPPSQSKVTIPLPRRMIRLSYFLTISFPNTLPPSSSTSLRHSLCPLHHRPLTVGTTPSTSSSSSSRRRLTFATLL